jgi:LacI family transcriptional regulator
MAITSHDVARLAGVSQPTVSRALRDQWGVSASTRRKVREAARTLGYVPIQAGRTLSTQTSGRIGIVSAELSNPFYPAIIEPVHDELARLGYRTILVTDRGHEPVELEPIIDGSLDGVILTTTELDSQLPYELRRRGVPFVLLNRDTRQPEYDACVVNNTVGVWDLAKLLLGLGHQRIGAIFGPDTASTGLERRTGFAQALGRLGASLPNSLTFSGPFSSTTGSQGFQYLWNAKPTAIFCANDVIALGALSEAAALGVRIPEDVTLVGFDNIPMSSWNIFGLTTVGVSLEEMAMTAVGLLTRRMDDTERAVQRVTMQPVLTLRSTHGRPRALDAETH